MYIQSPEIASFFGIPPQETTGTINGLGQKLSHIPDTQDCVVLLGEQRTLYDYSLLELYNLQRVINSKTMFILCSSLTAARGSGQRRWINTQNNESNCNANICINVPKVISDSIWDLQERISVAIADTIKAMSPNSNVEIAYPFHYLLDGGKVAGHLIQKIRMNTMDDYVRIGIGVNTAKVAPSLPTNDHLATHLYSAPKSLEIAQSHWIQLVQSLAENIQTSLSGESRHKQFLDYLTIQGGEVVTLYRDDGTTQFGDPYISAEFDTIHEDGTIQLDGRTIPRGEYHIRKNSR